MNELDYGRMFALGDMPTLSFPSMATFTCRILSFTVSFDFVRCGSLFLFVFWFDLSSSAALSLGAVLCFTSKKWLISWQHRLMDGLLASN